MIMNRSLLILFLVFLFSCEGRIESSEDKSDGYKMLLIGHSFFRPYASNLEKLALDSGFTSHDASLVFRGGENGRPINFWKDSSSDEHKLIKSILDSGGIEYFGMTAEHDQDNPVEGHSAWIKYALQKNPNITIFISISPFDFPNGNQNGTRPNWDIFASDYGFNSIQEFYDFYVNEIIHKEIVDKLRLEFPSTKIFTIPTGWATKNLAQMQLNETLLDEITLFGPKETSIFTDQKGHQGQIVIETGTLIWLNKIYNVNLQTNDYSTGFKTDLHYVAQEIIENHDSNY